MKSLGDVRPDLLKEWDFKTNALDPFKVGAQSKRKVIWICSKGHSFPARIDHRVKKNSGCPCKNGKMVTPETSLETIRPDLAKEWHYERNGNLLPSMVTPGSAQEVWWLCPVCKREWKSSISNRRRYEQGCTHPFQVNLQNHSLVHDRPDLAAEWDYESNGSLQPRAFHIGSANKVGWVCSTCGNRWLARINHRTGGHEGKWKPSGCPKCSGRPSKGTLSKDYCLAVKNPSISQEWHPSENGDLTPWDVTPNSSKNVSWLCSECQKVWKTTVDNRNNGKGCPKCNRKSSFPEICLWFYLKKVFSSCENPFNLPGLTKGSHVDVYIEELNLAIEYDGYWYHLNRKDQDEAKNRSLQALGKKLIRVREALSENKRLPELVPHGSTVIEYRYPRQLEQMIQQVIVLTSQLTDVKTKGKLLEVDINVERDRALILSELKGNLSARSLAAISPKTAEQWHPVKNERLTPWDVKPKSDKTIWWQCAHCQKEWSQIIKLRTRSKYCCPYCKELKEG